MMSLKYSLMKKFPVLFRNSTIFSYCALCPSSKGFYFKNYHTLKLNTCLQFAICCCNLPTVYISVNVILETYIKIEKATRDLDISLLWSHLRMDSVYPFLLQRTDPL